MTWKERLRVSPSNAEIKLLKVCNKHNLWPLTDEKICLMWTIPDQLYPQTPFRQRLPFYLDGIEVHSSETAELRDENINTRLTKLKTPPLRIRYMPRGRDGLSNARAERAYKLIRETLGMRLSQPRFEEV